MGGCVLLVWEHIILGLSRADMGLRSSGGGLYRDSVVLPRDGIGLYRTHVIQ